MPNPMPTNETLRRPTPEILNPDHYGVYGRLLIATEPGQNITTVLNPDNTNVGGVNIVWDRRRDYNPITEKLSLAEREAAWHGVTPDEAKKQWRKRFTDAVRAWDTEGKNKALHVLSGKTAGDFSEADTDNLYNAFCVGGSNSTEFVQSIVQNAPKDADGKISQGYFQEVAPHLKWLASKFFGAETSNVVEKMLELQVGINNEQKAAVDKIIADPEKIKTLSGPEKNILRPVYQSFQEPVPAGPVITPEPAVGTPVMLSDEDEEQNWAAVLGGTPPVPDEETVTPKVDEVTKPAPPAAPEPEPATGESQPPAVEPEPEKKPTMISEIDNEETFEAQLRAILGKNQDKQNVPIGLSIHDLPILLKLPLGEKLKNSGKVDFDMNKDVIIRGVEIEGVEGVVKLSVKNRGDGRGIEVTVVEGEVDDDIKEKLKNFNAGIEQEFNVHIRNSYPKWGVHRISLKGENEDKYVRIEVIPEGESVVTPDAVEPVQPAVEQEAPPIQPATPDETLI